jgi:hypothetical protein
MNRQVPRGKKWILARTGLALLLGSFGASLDLSAQPTIPETLDVPWASPEAPGWVREDVATEPGSERLATERFHSMSLSSLAEAIVTGSKEECIAWGQVFIDIVNPPLRGNLALNLSTSVFSFRGRVVGEAGGFFGGIPGTLVEVKPEEIYIQEDGVFRSETYFVFFPVGEVRLGNRKICKTDPSYPEVPAVGDDLVVFVPRHYKTAISRILDVIDHNGVITVKPDGRVLAPAELQATKAALPREELYAELQKLTRGSNRSQ